MSCMTKGIDLGSALEISKADNALNLIRFVLASSVIASHAFPIAGYSALGLEVIGSFGYWAVSGFFAISGFLISRSWIASPQLSSFILKRVLRIYPAFWVALLVGGFVLAPLYAILNNQGSYSLVDGFWYFLKNSSLLMLQHPVGDVLTGSSYPESFNGSLWTLAPEFTCYLATAALFLMARRRMSQNVLFWSALVLASFLHLVSSGGGFSLIHEASRLAVFYFAGAIIYLFRERLRFSRISMAGSLAIVAFLWLNPDLAFMSALPLGYFLIWLGLKANFVKWGQNNDFSYGIYIYAFPIQQFVALLFPAATFAAHVLLAIIFTFPLAILSWFLVERPAIRSARRLLAKFSKEIQ